MDAIELLTNQHREVEALFEQIESLGDGNGRQKKMLFSELALKVEHHAKIEEKFFYPEGQEVDEDVTLESYEEHALVRALIRKIKKTRVSDKSFMAKVTVLKELIEHHVEEEEQEYFPKVRKELGQEKLAELGEEMAAYFLRLEKRAGLSPAPEKQAA